MRHEHHDRADAVLLDGAFETPLQRQEPRQAQDRAEMGLERVDRDDRRAGGDDLVVELVLARDAEHGPLAGRAGQFEREGRESAAAAEIEEQRASGAHRLTKPARGCAVRRPA